LYTGEESSCHRDDILGVADLNRIPEWAKLKLKILEEKGLFTYGEKQKESSLIDKDFKQLNKDCASAIDGVLRSVRTDGEMAGTAYYDFDTALNKLNDQFGSECIEKVLAAIVMINETDGRFSQQNKNWAKGFDATQIANVRNDIRYVGINSHATILNGLVNKMRELQAEKQKKTPLLEKLDDNKKIVAANISEKEGLPPKEKKVPEVN